MIRHGIAAAASELRSGLDVPESGSFRAYIQRHNPTLLDFEHVSRLVDAAQRVVSGEIMRLMVIMPPRYLKSEIFSRQLPGYFLRQNPGLSTGLASYGAELAWSLSLEARHNYQADGGRLSSDSHAKKHWRTRDDGEMWATGTGGPMLGFGFHLGIVDDPTDPEKAHSPTYQSRFEDWWSAKFLSRQEPDARIVVVMQRLGTNDPIDFLLRREVGDETDLAPEHWHVVLCDEIKSSEPLARYDGPMGLPATCTLEPDPRKEGEPLAPSRFDLGQVEALQRSAGPYVAAAQRQQRPAEPRGDFWREEWFQVYDELPADAYNGGRDWDTAYTKKEANAASAYVESYRGPGKADEFPIYIEDCAWDWLEFPELVAWMHRIGGPHYIEEKATGKSAAQSLRREKVTVSEISVKGDKFARSSGVQPIVSAGRVHVNRRVLRKLLKGDRQGLLRIKAEDLSADRGHLDLNDTFVQALHRHAGRTRAPRVYFPGMDDKKEAAA